MNIDFHSFIRSIAKVIEAKDFYTAGHSDRVAGLSQFLAIKLGLPSYKVEEVHIAAHLHDIGKIGIPDGILMKSGVLTFAEFTLMKEHSAIGYRILEEIGGFKSVAKAVLCHHEQENGQGYPNGLKGSEIPFAASIISIADSYDAMTSKRNYKVNMSHSQAVEDIKKCSGEKYNKEIVECFISIENEIEKGGLL